MPNIKRNYLYNLCYQILTLIIPFVTAPYISRVFGPDGVGIYSYTSSIMTYFTMVAALGTAAYGTREIARLRDDRAAMSKAFWSIEQISALSTCICILLWIVLSLIYKEYTPYLLALLPTLIAIPFDISWFYIGIERVGYTVLRNSLCRILGVVCLFIFVRTRSDLTLYIFINSIISLLGNISMWTYLSQFVNRITFHNTNLKCHFNGTLVFFISGISISLYTVLDKLLIGLITGDNCENGYYEQANKILTIVKTISFQAIGMIMTARMSYLFHQELYDEIKDKMKECFDFVSLLSYGFMFGIIAVAANFVPVFFGDGYQPVIKLLSIMAVILVPISISNCIGNNYYTPSGNIGLATKLMLTGAIVNVIVNLCIIPFLKAEGAVIGSLVGEGLIAILFVKFCKEYIDWKIIAACSYKKIVAGISMIIISYVINKYLFYNAFVTVSIQIALCTFTYFICLFILRDSSLIRCVDILKSKISFFLK